MQTPTDCLWATYRLYLIDGGMAGFGKVDLGNADHRMLWIDITKTLVFGFHSSPLSKRPNDSISLHDPQITTCHNYV